MLFNGYCKIIITGYIVKLMNKWILFLLYVQNGKTKYINMKKSFYVKPAIEVIEFEFEGIIASSLNESDWGMDDLPSEPGRDPFGASDNIWDDKWLN